jgi:hypothetical protein
LALRLADQDGKMLCHLSTLKVYMPTTDVTISPFLVDVCGPISPAAVFRTAERDHEKFGMMGED